MEETFISHLVELRNRIMKASLAIIVVFVCLVPWAADIYDLLAYPMMVALPAGSKMIATGGPVDDVNIWNVTAAISIRTLTGQWSDRPRRLAASRSA